MTKRSTHIHTIHNFECIKNIENKQKIRRIKIQKKRRKKNPTIFGLRELGTCRSRLSGEENLSPFFEGTWTLERIETLKKKLSR